jgi:hypothetical protein
MTDQLCPRCGDPITVGCFPGDGVCQGVQVVTRKAAARQQANAALLSLPLTDYLALTRRERKRRLQAARKEGADRG